jgi:hypothetical protein
MPDLKVTRAEYMPAAKKLRVEGTGGVNITVKALLNPNLHGESDEQVFNNYDSITALDKKQKSNAVTFQFDLATGDTSPPFNLVVVASHGKGFQRPIPPTFVLAEVET